MPDAAQSESRRPTDSFWLPAGRSAAETCVNKLSQQLSVTNNTLTVQTYHMQLHSSSCQAYKYQFKYDLLRF